MAALAYRVRGNFPSWMDLKSLGLGGSESIEDMRSLGVRTPRGSTDRLHSGEMSGGGGSERPGSRVGYPREGGIGIVQSVEEEEGLFHGCDEMDQTVEPWELGQVMLTGGGGGGGGGGNASSDSGRNVVVRGGRPEGGIAALRDLTALTMGTDALDFIAP